MSARRVIVVGSGAAGLVAAIAASDAGARVTVLERSEFVGGTTAVSGGGVWMPAPEERDAALGYCRRMGADERIETFLDRGPGIIKWLQEVTPLRLRPMSWPDYHPEMEGAAQSGRMFEPALYRRTSTNPPVRPAPVLGLPITLEEATVDWRPSYTPAAFDARAVRQRVTDGLVATGQALVAALLDACLERGVEFVMSARARSLTERDGRIGGVDKRSADAVVLATGGFEWNEALRDRFLGGPLQHPASPPTNEGDGLVMAMEVGADLGNMTQAWWYPAGIVPGEEYEGHQLARFVATERTAPHTIIVNRFGQRFVNEAANYNDMQKAFLHFDANEYANRNLPCWVVFDSQYRERYPVLTIRPGAPDPAWLHTAPTLEDLAAGVGIDPDGLRSTVDRWNLNVAAGHDPDFGRGASAYDRFHGDPGAPNPTLGSVQRAPFYALDVHAGTVGTKGGPRTDTRGAILHVRGHALPGLFGAGNVIASPAGPAYFGGGTSIALAIVFGYLSGTAAAAEA